MCEIEVFALILTRQLVKTKSSVNSKALTKLFILKVGNIYRENVTVFVWKGVKAKGGSTANTIKVGENLTQQQELI